jgi:hypothetical protein
MAHLLAGSHWLGGFPKDELSAGLDAPSLEEKLRSPGRAQMTPEIKQLEVEVRGGAMEDGRGGWSAQGVRAHFLTSINKA